MKRKWAYLALPLILAALMLGVKWRAEHPTPTKEDLQIRALIRRPYTAYLSYDPSSMMSDRSEMSQADLFYRELEIYAENFYVLPHDPLNTLERPNGVCDFELYFLNAAKGSVNKIDISLKIGTFNSTCILWRTGQQPIQRSLHPTTVKRWLQLLRNHPQIGPELRARVK